MLKTTFVYDVTIKLNDGKEMTCLLLTKPDALTLAAIAEKKSAGTELTEAMAFVREIVLQGETAEGNDNITEIVVAGTKIGTVTVVPLPAYIATPKRGRKPKPREVLVVDPVTPPPDPPAVVVESAEAVVVSPSPPTGGKRGGRKK